MAQWLFEQPALSRELIATEVRSRLRMEFDQSFSAAMNAVRRQIRTGNALNIDVTPSVFINGKRLPDHRYLDHAIRYELRAAGHLPNELVSRQGR